MLIGSSWAYFRGTGTFYRKSYGSKKWKKVASATFPHNYYAAKRVKPKRRTVYRFDYGGSATIPASRSQQLVVKVRAGLTAKVQDRTLKQGQKVVVKGKVLPKTKGMKIRLQRKIGKKWRTIATTRTTRKGTYTVSKKTTSAGTWKVRVRVNSGKGLVGVKTKALRKIKIAKVKAPKPVSTDVNSGSGNSTRPDVGYVAPAPIRRPAPPPTRGAAGAHIMAATPGSPFTFISPAAPASGGPDV